MAMHRCVPAIVLTCVVSLPRGIGAQAPGEQRSTQQPRTCGRGIPANVDAGLLAPDMIALLQRSETFRAQCERLAAAPAVRVRVEVVNSLDGGRAQTSLRRYAYGALQADVVVVFGENYGELLAHEFEHVIEQIDGVDLRQEAALGRAWRVDGGAFETRRAAVVGKRVRRECDAAHAGVLAASLR